MTDRSQDDGPPTWLLNLLRGPPADTPPEDIALVRTKVAELFALADPTDLVVD